MTIEVRRINKTVAVNLDVEITPTDAAKALTNDELRRECARRGIELKSPKAPGSRHKIAADEIDDILACWRRGDFDDALFKLEWALPQPFRGFADAIAKHYRETK